MELKILFEDHDVIVCYKPAGIPTQTSKIGMPDMVSVLKNYLYKKQTEKKEPYVAVIHRLDQPVEGILVFAKTPFAAKELSRQLQKESFGKYYKAVLCGVPEHESGSLENYLVKDAKTNTSRVCDASVKDAKKAVLCYQTIAVLEETDEKKALTEIKLETGRHHQIRVQTAHMGCPIWGDSKYNKVQKEEKRRRQTALCAYKLCFVHPRTKKPMKFEIEPQGEGFLEFTRKMS